MSDAKLAARARRYGLTAQQLETLLALRPGCWICGKLPPPPLHRRYIDHDHKTGRVRGVLCFTCNYRLLGKGALNDPKLHFAAGNYLMSAFDGRKL